MLPHIETIWSGMVEHTPPNVNLSWNQTLPKFLYVKQTWITQLILAISL